MKQIVLSAASAMVLALAACQQEGPAPNSATNNPATQTPVSTAPANPKIGSFGIELEHIDETVKPGDDFNRFVNGKWLDNFEIPADKSTYGIFTGLADTAEKDVRAIIEETAAANPSPDSLEGQIAALYNAYKDVDAINKAGLLPVQSMLDQIQAIETREDLARVFAQTGYSAPFGGWVDVDSKQTDQYTFYLQQSGLGMPDRAYYLDDTEKNVELRAAYKDLLEAMLTSTGYEDAASASEAIYALEVSIADAHWDRAIGRNRNLTYNKVSKAELVALAEDFPITIMLNEIGLGAQPEFIVRQLTPTTEEVEENGLTPEDLGKLGPGLPGLMKVAAKGDLNAWKAYLTAHLLIDYASVLPSEIDDAVFEFYGKTLRGQPEQRERWKRAVDTVEGAVGEAVGKVYVDRHFKPEAKAAVSDLVENLRKAMGKNLDNLEWMSEETKVEARDKLANFTPKVGYPERFETYESLRVSADSAFQNALAADDWAWNDMISQLGQPIDKGEWFMTPQTVNAYYSPNRNEIVFPAAILQPPFFDLNADPAVNYGAIGGVIGHEMGHGFDDQGSKSDGKGVLRNWWTDSDLAAFKARTNKLVAQYNEFCPIKNSEDDTVCVKGAQTLGENIGDLGGLSMAYTAYKLSLNGKEAPVIDGYSGDQRFFMAWAQVWAFLSREEAMRARLVSAVHSPPEFRINGVVRNMDAWYEAFGVEEGDALYIPPEERVSIW